MTKIYKICISAVLLIAMASCKNQTQTILENTEGRIEIYDREMLNIIDTSENIQVLCSGFSWSEGPVWVDELNALLFTDVPNNIIYKWSEKGGKQVYLTPSGHSLGYTDGGTEGANGLALDIDNKLLLCQHGNRAVAKMMSDLGQPKDSFQFLTQKFNNQKYNSPNDLCVTKNGIIFFTDPPYGLPDQDTAKAKQMSHNGVFKLTKDGQVTLIDSTLSKPNGIALSKDEKYMYVSNSDPAHAVWYKYALDTNYNVIERTLFADATHLVGKYKGLPDGLKISKNGYLFASGPGGILVFNQDSRNVGMIYTDQATSNCAFNTAEDYLYMTADKHLMRIKIKN